MKACSLDTLARDPEQPVAAECFLTFEAKALRECREALSGPGGVSDAYAYAEANPHPRLWRLVGEAALEKLELTVAEKALVQCEDYLGIQLVKKLKLLDAKKQAAEVAVHFGRFDDAEKLYRQMDRRDLALELRVRLGEWTKVVQLVQQGGGDDDLLTTAYNKIGDQFLERHEPKKAVAYYAQAKNSEALLECYEKLEDYAGLEKLVASLPDGHVLLAQIGRRFAAAGMAPEAVAAFTKGGDIKAAIDSCVEQNCWGAAVALAEESGNAEIGKRLGEYAAELIDGGRQLHAVELYMSAHQYADAAKLLSRLGKAEGEARLHPLRVKKLYVIAAMEVERMKRKMLGGPAPGATQTAAQTLQSLVTQDASTGADARARVGVEVGGGAPLPAALAAAALRRPPRRRDAHRLAPPRVRAVGARRRGGVLADRAHRAPRQVLRPVLEGDHAAAGAEGPAAEEEGGDRPPRARHLHEAPAERPRRPQGELPLVRLEGERLGRALRRVRRHLPGVRVVGQGDPRPRQRPALPRVQARLPRGRGEGRAQLRALPLAAAARVVRGAELARALAIY